MKEMKIPGLQITATLYTLSTAIGTAIDVANTWTLAATFEGHFQPVTRAERQANNKDTAFGKYVFFVAYADLTAVERAKLIESNRIVIDSKNYNIDGVEEWLNRFYAIYLRLVE